MGDKVQFELTANQLLGAINDVKSLLGLLNSALNNVSARGSRGFLAQREGSIVKVNPTFDVNLARSNAKEVRDDLDAMLRALYAFNGQQIAYDVLTVSAALREEGVMERRISEVASSVTSNIMHMYVEGDEIFPENVSDLMGEWTDKLTERRRVKNAIANTNNLPVQFTVTNDLVKDILLKGFVL